MDAETRFPTLEHLPFYITAPGETDILLGAVALTLVAVVIGFGALYFTIQAIPDRIAKGTSKAQMQVVGLLGLISLFTMNNLYWIAAILLAAVRLPDFVSPLKDIAASLRARPASSIDRTSDDSMSYPKFKTEIPETPNAAAKTPPVQAADIEQPATKNEGLKRE